MNNRFLFRAKRIDNEKWVIGLLTKITGQLHIVNQNDEITIYSIDKSTLCQCTGLKDKKGTLIWENDVVKCQNIVGKFGWNEKHLAFTIFANIKGNMQHYFIESLLNKDIEVIGNIFDNPELLEENKSEK